MSASTGKRPAVVIAGPTCSGKSALALSLAERVGGAVINADSMQVYRELRVLTARPAPADEARAPHALYGVRPAAEASTAAWWRDAALAAMRQAEDAGCLPILCGGTGMYLASLTQRLADIPDPGAAARAEARALLAELGPAGLHARLCVDDPQTAAALRPSDSQRLARAWEVWRGTGTGLAAWQRGQAREAADFPWRLRVVILDPPRQDLRAAIAGRFETMLREGALEEVRALLALGLDPGLPAMRAHGVPELAAYLRGELLLGEAARRASVATSQYTRRQATWFRHRHIAAEEDTHRFLARYAGQAQLMERILTETLQFIRPCG
jgi:tRNA dimethylallyltransferase